jgi:drug/metabolite transporter (DMT)-like permease
VEIVLAITSALLFALGSVLQQKAGLADPAEGASSGVLLRVARRPLWLAGIAGDGLGFVAQAAALGNGRLAVVQPLLVLSVVFALPLGAWLGDQPLHRIDVAAAGLVVVALIGFLTIAQPAGGRREAPLGNWVIAGVVCAGVCAPLTFLGHRGPSRRRAALLGTATGILFAVSAALTKAVVDDLHAGLPHVLAGWELYALIAVGFVSMTLNQLSLNTGSLATTLATSSAFDPIVSVVLGLTVFREVLHATGPRVAGAIAALTVALAGMAMLARSETRGAEPAGP